MSRFWFRATWCLKTWWVGDTAHTVEHFVLLMLAFVWFLVGQAWNSFLWRLLPSLYLFLLSPGGRLLTSWPRDLNRFSAHSVGTSGRAFACSLPFAFFCNSFQTDTYPHIHYPHANPSVTPDWPFPSCNTQHQPVFEGKKTRGTGAVVAKRYPPAPLAPPTASGDLHS